MASTGDVITYTGVANLPEYDSRGRSVLKTEDVSNVDRIVIQEMHGQDGSWGYGYSDPPINQDGIVTSENGSGGYIEQAVADVSDYDTINIYVATILPFIYSVGKTDGNQSRSSTIGVQRDYQGMTICGFNNEDAFSYGRYSGATTVITAGSDTSNADLVAIAYGGGTSGLVTSSRYCTSGDNLSDKLAFDGASAAKSTDGLGGEAGTADKATGTVTDPGDGGQELGIASGGTLIPGGSKDGDGEITLAFTGKAPKFDDEIELDEKRNGKIPSVSYPSQADKLRIYRATGDDPTYPDDYTQVDDVSGTSISDYVDKGSPYDAHVHYAVVAVEADGTEKLAKAFSDQYIPHKDAARIGDN